jgi:hypothetical protein
VTTLFSSPHSLDPDPQTVKQRPDPYLPRFEIFCMRLAELNKFPHNYRTREMHNCLPSSYHKQAGRLYFGICVRAACAINVGLWMIVWISRQKSYVRKEMYREFVASVDVVEGIDRNGRGG